MRTLRTQAFTLLEVLLAISLASFIMMGVMQIHRGVMRYIEVTRQTMSVNRKVCLVFNQVERDICTAFIPFPHQPVSELSPEGVEIPQDADKKKKDAEKREEERKAYFIAGVNENVDTMKVGNKRLLVASHISFICTNPFQVYGEKRMRLVRVIYELIPDKMKRTEDFQTFQLVRKETYDLLNTRGVVDAYAPPALDKVVRKYVVMDGIKAMAMQYTARIKDLRKTDEEKKKKEKPNPDAPKTYTAQLWGDVFKTQGILPESISIWLDVWNDDRTKIAHFQILFALAVYPTIDEAKQRASVDKSDKQDKKPDGADGALQQGSQSSPEQLTAEQSAEQQSTDGVPLFQMPGA